jgi:aminoglycoside phosphotransferase (APT) family kinase protein
MEICRKGVLRMFLSKQISSACETEAKTLRFLNGADAPRIFAASTEEADKKSLVSHKYIIEEFVEGHSLAKEISSSGLFDSHLQECANLLIDLHSKDISALRGTNIDQSKEATSILTEEAHRVLTTDFASMYFPNVQKILRDSKIATSEVQIPPRLRLILLFFLTAAISLQLQNRIVQSPEQYLGSIVLCHGDVCFDNFYRRAADSKLMQLDWEFAHLGCPLEDLASLVNENRLSSEKEEVLMKNYFRSLPMTYQQREAFWAWKIRRSFGLFTIVIDRLRLMEEGVSSELDNRQIYTEVVNAEVEYVTNLLSNRP